MKIYIPSRGRPDARRTQRSIEGCWPNEDIITVVDKDEYKEYRAAMPDDEILIYPGPPGVGAKRQWIVERHEQVEIDQRLIMLDDDLRFMLRRKDDYTKAVKIKPIDTNRMFKAIESTLTKYVHGSVLARQGANTMPNDAILYNRRIMRVLAYDARKVLAAGARFDRLQLMEDFDVTLQLLELGYKNFTLCRWWQDQYGSNDKGGCSAYRTPDLQARMAHALKALHPDVVTVVEKPETPNWTGGPRLDVRVQWKKSYRSNL